MSYATLHSLPLKLKPLFVGQLSTIDALRESAYAYINGKFEEVIRPNETITNEFIREYASNTSKEIFVSLEDFDEINNFINSELLKITRSLSIGDPLKNSTRHVNFLSLQMSNLYQDPFNDELLSNQFQSTKNLSSLLLKNKGLTKDLYKNVLKQGHHYTIAQPLLSSIMLLGFLQSIGLFSEKEIQTLFLTSYFKDIGMSFIPREKFELAHLTEFDKKIFSEHAENSMKILNGRVPLSQSQLEIIKNHHFLNYKIQKLVMKQTTMDKDELIHGVESTFLSALDILVAMTNERPYRDAVSMFQALELLKKVLSDEYPQEFRNLVNFLRQFFSK
tara:strand:+ start:52339 stop:53337 length:999 start_codon:yes stop_codon:yes gene_type:complete